MLLDVLSAFLDTTGKMAPWLLGGFLLAGFLSLWVSPGVVSRYLGRRRGWRAILWAVGLGVPLPLCSCGVLPVAVGLRKNGAGRGAVAAFLISTPQTGVDSFLATWSLLGVPFALMRIVVAVITGLVGGLLVNALDHDVELTTTEVSVSISDVRGIVGRIRAAALYGFGTLFGSVSAALLVGLVISACIWAFVPPEVFSERWLGNDWLAFPVMLLVGMPMYVCSTASIPVALALMAKGLSPGAALVFLIVGPALNGASLTTLLKLLGRRCTVIHLSVVAGFSVAAGAVLNGLNARFDFLPRYQEMEGECCRMESGAWFSKGCVVAILFLFGYHLLFKPMRQRMITRKKYSSEQTVVTVRGMSCDHCRTMVERLLEHYPGVSRVTQMGSDAFGVEGVLPDTLRRDLKALGFELVE